MICRVPSPALLDLGPALRLACPARSLNGLQERGAADAAARGRRAAPHRAELLRELGHPDQAHTADRRALELTTNPAEQAVLQQRLAWV